MNSKFMSIISIFFPWIVFLIDDNPAAAILALILQASVIGWIPASIWAFKVVKENRLREQAEKKAQEENQPIQKEK